MAGPATSQTALPQEATTQLDSPRTAQCRPASENQVCEISQGELLNPKECANLDGPGPSVNLDTLEPQQLAQVKKQLDEELEHLTSSFGQLHGAQSKFKECLRCVNSRSEASPGTYERNTTRRCAGDICCEKRKRSPPAPGRDRSEGNLANVIYLC